MELISKMSCSSARFVVSIFACTCASVDVLEDQFIELQQIPAHKLDDQLPLAGSYLLRENAIAYLLEVLRSES